MIQEKKAFVFHDGAKAAKTINYQNSHCSASDDFFVFNYRLEETRFKLSEFFFKEKRKNVFTLNASFQVFSPSIAGLYSQALINRQLKEKLFTSPPECHLILD